MLRELLALIAAGHKGTSESIARDLGLRAPQIEDMLARLLALGYIEDLAASCADGPEGKSTGCAGCSLCAGHVGPQAHVWALTPKGRDSLGTEKDGAGKRGSPKTEG
jgi:hypothetical protein